MVFVQNFKHINQYMIFDDYYIYLQSYNSIVARLDTRNKELELYKDWNYSNTTLRHLYLFLQENCYSIYKQICSYRNKKYGIEQLIKNGIIVKCY